MNNSGETKVEIQIRTIAMDFWASLEHKIYYKFEGNAPARIQNQLKECADIVSYLDQKMLSINEDIQTFQQQEESGIVEDKFQDMIKASYGTVYKEDAVETEVEVISEVIENSTKKQNKSNIKESKVMQEATNFFFRKKESKA